MKRNIKNIIRNTALMLTVSNFQLLLITDATAQKDTVYNESVIVNVGFNPIVTDANKITENPSIFDTSFSQINLTFDKIDKGYQHIWILTPLKQLK